MSASSAITIRDFLTAQPERSATSTQIHKGTGLSMKTIRRCCDLSMPDVYIDRWIKAKNGQYSAVYVLVYVPKNCPHPRREYHVDPIETQWKKR